MKKRIWIVGAPGAGKTTLARELHTRLHYPLIELDDLYWTPNWGRKDEKEFQQCVKAYSEQSTWIIDGEYPQVREIIKNRYDCLILLQFPIRFSIFHIIKRTIRGCLTGQSVCGGNKESIIRLFGQEGLIRYAIKQHHFYSNTFLKYSFTNIYIIKNKKDWNILLNEICEVP